jgi:hypothetical protein
MAAPNVDNLMSQSAWMGKDPHQFADPFMSFSSMAMPTNIDEANRWVEFIMGASGVYRAAVSRVIAYFITDIEIQSKSDGDGKERIGKEEKQQYIDFLENKLGIRTLLQTVALDFLTYGNSFTSVLMPFRRYLACPGCGFESPLNKVANSSQFGYRFASFEFTAKCPQCRFSGVWRHIDRRAGSSGDVVVKRWSPHEMAICYDQFTGAREYIWKIPEDYRQQIKRGDMFQLEKCNWEVVETIKNNQHLWFDKGIVYHMREEPLAGIRSQGWGISRVLSNFRQAWYVQLLHAYNEALALDYIIPFRVITPAARKGSGAEGGTMNDPVLNMNMGDFQARVKRMISNRRRDPAQWNVLPSPIEYQALGGDATQLAPKELLELGMDTLLTAIGVPVEMYKGSLSVQAAPAALRLFEAYWSNLVYAMNQQLSHIVEKVGEIFNWEPVTAKLVRVTHADDLNRQMAKLQLMMGGQISRTTGLNSIGADFAEEERMKLEEERVVAEETEKLQEEMDQQANITAMSQGPPAAGPIPQPPMPGMPGQMPMMQGMPGAMPGGGAPAPPAGDPAAGGAPPAPGAPPGAAQAFGSQQMPTSNQPTTVDEMLSKATTIAQQAMGLSEGQRKSYLITLRKENPVMADLVQSQLDQMRNQARMQGGDMLMQQQQQAAQQQPGALPPQ